MTKMVSVTVGGVTAQLRDSGGVGTWCVCPRCGGQNCCVTFESAGAASMSCSVCGTIARSHVHGLPVDTATAEGRAVRFGWEEVR